MSIVRLVCSGGLLALALAMSSCGGDDDGETTAERAPGDAATARLEPSPASVAASRRRVHAGARPRAGGERTVFWVWFRGHARLGDHDGRRRGYEIALRGRNTGACLVNPHGYVTRGRPGHVVTIRLDPSTWKGGVWCRSTYRGRIYYYDGYACPDRGRCEEPPGFERLRRPVGRVSLRIR